MVLLQRKQYFSKDPEGVQHFLWGPAFSRGCPNAYFYRNSYKLRFSRGGSGPPIPLWIRTCISVQLDSLIWEGGSTFSWGGGPNANSYRNPYHL